MHKPTKDEIVSVLSYDRDTGVFKWNTSKLKRVRNGDVAGFSTRGYIGIGLFGKQYKAHRIAWVIEYGEWPESELDHINGDRTDNRICNLRLANRFINNQNKRRSAIGSSSKYIGVCFSKSHNKWMSKVKINGKTHYLGIFDDEEKASIAYQKAKEAMIPHYVPL